MEYRSLGRTGVMVSPLCLGTMTFGWEPDDWGSTEAESAKVFERAWDLGINFYDTANVYARGVSETILGKFLKGKRDASVVATKVHGRMGDGPNESGNSRRHIIQQCEESLKRLQTDWIDLYQLHRPQPSIPIDETLRAMDDLIRAGKVRYIGTSTFAAWQMCEAHYVARELGVNRFVSEQPPYNLFDRRIERELLPFCRTYGYATIVWSPLAGGQLTGKYLDGAKDGRYSKSDPNERVNDATMKATRRLKRIADSCGVSLTTLSLSWILSNPVITSAIIGARKPSHFDDLVAALSFKPTAATMKKIDEIFKPGEHLLPYYEGNFGPNTLPI
jgi:aryl-alcohol dehydrogenase-like predicted oxidoreductase